MKSIKIISVLFLCCIALSFPAFAKSPIWKISKDGNHLFLGGTVHVLNQSDYPLPDAFETAYNNSILLVLETDLQKFEAPEFQPTILQKTMYPGEQNIKRFLNPETMQALKTHLTNRGIPIEPMLKFKPGFLSVTLTAVELQRLGLVGIGVDKFYSLKALNEKKGIKHLETVNEQLEFISNMGKGNENELIKYTLSDLKDLPKLFDDLKEAWKTGDNARLQAIGLDPLNKHFPKIYNSLFVERNNNWIPQIETMLKTKEVEFILFGAIHLVGEDGILSQLKALGYKIENL